MLVTTTDFTGHQFCFSGSLQGSLDNWRQNSFRYCTPTRRDLLSTCIPPPHPPSLKFYMDESAQCLQYYLTTNLFCALTKTCAITQAHYTLCINFYNCRDSLTYLKILSQAKWYIHVYFLKFKNHEVTHF